MNRFHKIMKSPVGMLTLVTNELSLIAILWEEESPRRVKNKTGQATIKNPILQETESQLLEYFARKRRVFTVPIEFEGTEFQKKVWDGLRKIPYGETRSYSELAREIHSPRSCRAVGAANGKNPVSIIVPCHRVIGASGSLTGFAGGLQTKAFLLNLEKHF